MTELEIAIKNALDLSGSSTEVNKAYIEFIKANFIIPIESCADSSAEPQVLYLIENDHAFLPVFTDQVVFDAWAHDIGDKISLLKLSGVDLLKGIGEEVTLCLNIGSKIYKEFNPSEIERMRSLVLKFFRD